MERRSDLVLEAVPLIITPLTTRRRIEKGCTIAYWTVIGTGIEGDVQGKTFVVTLTVNVSATDCAQSATWTSGAWTGSAFGGDAFALVASKSQLVTQIASNCEVRFVPGSNSGWPVLAKAGCSFISAAG